MVSVRPKKAKYTYAERVLHALSQIQREHRKHAVHIATIRAQVRKTAEERKDKLGPQWPQWVSRTLRKLEDEGVVEIDAAHNVTMTPSARKAFASTRRESSVARGVPNEDIVARSVAYQFASGVKRRRRPSVGRGVTPAEDVYDSISAYRPSAKKARGRSATAISRRPTADVDAYRAEISKLREEVLSLRRQLAEHRCEPTVFTETRDALALSTPPRPVTPPVEAQRAAERRPLTGVIRTQSGSLIHQYSKQPTPAPSEPFELEHLHADFEMPPPEREGVDLRGREIVRDTRYLATPPPSSPVMSRRAVSVETEVPHVAEREGIANSLSSLRSKVAQLEGELSEKQNQLTTMHLDLVAEQARSQSLQTSFNELQNELRAKDAALTQAQSSLGTADTSLASAQRASGSMETKLRSQLTAVEEQLFSVQRERDELQARIATLESELTKSQDLQSSTLQDNEELRSKISAREDSLSHLRAEVAADKELVDSLESRCRTLESRCGVAESQSSEAAGQVSRLTSELRAFEESSQLERSKALEIQQSLTAQLNTVNLSLEASKAVEMKLREEAENMQKAHTTALSTLQTSMDSLQEQLTSSNQTVERLREELRTVSEHEQSLTTDLVARDATISQLQAVRDKASEQASMFEKELARNRAKIGELELALDETSFRLRKTEGEFDGLRDTLLLEKDEHVVLKDRIASAHSDNERLKAELADKHGQLTTLQADLVATQEREAASKQATRDQIAELERHYQSELADREAKLSSALTNLGTVEASLRDMQDQLHSERGAKEKLSADLVAASDEVASLRSTVESHVALVARLEQDMQKSNARGKEAAEEIEELKKARADDEVNFTHLREEFARLREKHLQTLAEFDDKMVTAKPTPISTRKGTSVESRTPVSAT